eukprot:4655311-Heterocapsa_arctica.AAC.1
MISKTSTNNQLKPPGPGCNLSYRILENRPYALQDSVKGLVGWAQRLKSSVMSHPGIIMLVVAGSRASFLVEPTSNSN